MSRWGRERPTFGYISEPSGGTSLAQPGSLQGAEGQRLLVEEGPARYDCAEDCGSGAPFAGGSSLRDRKPVGIEGRGWEMLGGAFAPPSLPWQQEDASVTGLVRARGVRNSGSVGLPFTPQVGATGRAPVKHVSLHAPSRSWTSNRPLFENGGDGAN